MNNTTQLGLCCALALFSFLPCQGQEDARLWTKVEIKKKWTQRWDLGLQNCLRLGENYTRVNSYYVQLEAQYTLFKGIAIGGALRRIYRRKTTPEYHVRHRMSVWLNLEKKVLPRWELHYRPMYLRQYTDVYTSEKGGIPTDYFRHKVALQYKPNTPYRPFVFGELFYRVRYDYRDFNRIRYGIGVDYRFNKHHKTTLSYQIQKRINEPRPITAYVLALEYCFVF